MTSHPLTQIGRARAVIERVAPEINGGRFPIKRTVGEEVMVEADIFVDGHDNLCCLLLHRPAGSKTWTEVPMETVGNDRWHACFHVFTVGRHEYTVAAHVDHFLTWQNDLARRLEAEDIIVALKVGASLVAAAAGRADGSDSRKLKELVVKLGSAATPEAGRIIAQSDSLTMLMAAHGDRLFNTEYDRVLEVVVDIKQARFSTWYELFPRSCLVKDMTHGNFNQVIKRLPDIAAMGFDVLYLPPIHPIGNTFRKGPNNNLVSGSDDTGSPWAIGSAEGGHRAIYSKLGSAKDFRRLVMEARKLGIEVALDIAFQCSPDHPYVTQHPEWFCHRPDGSIQYAENPPKKYQDIYPFDFECEDWKMLWNELKGVVDHWISEGVRIFRVDNPHTKPFHFWEWLINSVKVVHPDTIFLAEAFTRPKVMHRLAKLGFTQSYTYFTWRNTKQELTDYFTELTKDKSREYFLPNLWPNTPDILPEFLQHNGRPGFLLRVALAATLGANYGIYGPAYELMEDKAIELGSEEYLNSEKYQIRNWDLKQLDSLRDFIASLNRIRRENHALQSDWSLRFHVIDNPLMICYSKKLENDILIMVANLDMHNAQSGWIELPLAELDLPFDRPYQAHDLLSDARFWWQGTHNFVRLDPQVSPMHILRLRSRLRSERDIDNFL